MHNVTFKVLYCVGMMPNLNEVNVPTMTQSHTGSVLHKFPMKSTLYKDKCGGKA